MIRLIFIALVCYPLIAYAVVNKDHYYFTLSCVSEGLRVEVFSRAPIPQQINTRMALGNVGRFAPNELGLIIKDKDGQLYINKSKRRLSIPEERDFREVYSDRFFGRLIKFADVYHSYQLPIGKYSIQAVHQNLFLPYDQDPPELHLKSNFIEIVVGEHGYKCSSNSTNL